MWELMDVNVVAPTVMTHMLLPQMVKRGRGAIINVCSMAALTPPTPLLTAYTATAVSWGRKYEKNSEFWIISAYVQAYLNNFSRALKYENQHKGIVVQVRDCHSTFDNSITLYTHTPSTQTLLPCNISRSSWSTLFTPSPSAYVQHALSTFGVSSHAAGYWPHALQVPSTIGLRLCAGTNCCRFRKKLI